jgi:signal transduction histidine kinase
MAPRRTPSGSERVEPGWISDTIPMKRAGKKLQKVFELFSDPLLVCESDGRVIKVNQAAKTALDLGESGHIRDVVSLEKSFVFDSDLILHALERRDAVVDVRFQDHDGNTSDVAATIVDLEPEDEKSTARLIHVKDFSSFRNYERWKDELISMAAHEIKNPLFAMKNSLNILMSQAAGPVTDGQHKFLTASIRSIDRVTRLLEGLLDVSRISLGKYVVERRWVNVEEFVTEVADQFRTLFNVRRLDIRCAVAPGLERVFTDTPKLEQVLINLLGNAVKFTPDTGTIVVSARPASLEALPDDLRILPWREIGELRFLSLSVRDSGIGMSEDTLVHLFTRYYQRPAGSPGSGAHLGFSISKKLVEVQNGSLEIESHLGVGTEVVVQLPADEYTSRVLDRLRSIEHRVDRLVRARNDADLYVVRKQKSCEWTDILNRWAQKPAVNPVSVQDTDGFFFWELGEHTAALIAVDDERIPLTGDHDWVHHAQDHVIARCRVAVDGTRAADLLGLAFKRLKYTSPVGSNV